MRIRHALLLTGLMLGAVVSSAALADVTLQTRHLRLVIGGDGLVKSLTAKPSGVEYAWLSEPASVAAVYRGGKMAVASQEDFDENEVPVYRGGRIFPATRASLTDDRLLLAFDGAGVAATYQVITTDDYLALRLLALEGDPIDRIDLVQLRIKRLPNLGPWIDVAYDDHFGVCLCGGNLQTNAGMIRRPQFVEMKAVATSEVKLQGATAVLVGCPQPKAHFLDAMEVVERDFRLPAGARNRRSPIQRQSYLWCRPTPGNVGQYIQLAKRAGLRTILFSYWAVTEGAGHFVWNRQFPNGAADLKQVTDAIRGAGLNVGLHIHYSKAIKSDSYVSPVPDDRLHLVRRFTLAGTVDEKTGTIAVAENPAGCTRDEGRRILKIGKELVAYRKYTTEPPFAFTGCERGHLKTTPAAHRQGEPAGLLDVDDWHVFVRFDQNTDIQDEAARRIAEIVRQTGPYDVLYFDGAEDVHDPYWYHVAGAQDRVYRLLEPAPPVCEGAMSGHFSWHILTRGNAYDLPEKHIKEFCHEVACRTAPVRAADFTRINFGWIFALYADMGPDVLEYVLSRGAAWDCPFSIVMDLKQVASHPRAEDCLEVIETWEDARIEGKLSEAQRAMLKTRDPRDHQFVKVWHAVLSKRWIDAWSKAKFADQEHHLLVNEKGDYEVVPIQEIPGLCGGRVRAYMFQRASQPGTTYVLIWAVKNEARLALPIPPERLALLMPFGKRLAIQAKDGQAIVPVGSRRYLVFTGIGAQEAGHVVRQARILP
jgi:hypothetical protein